MAQTRICIMQPVTIAEGITCHAMRVDTSAKHWVNKPYYELVKTIDGQEIAIKVRTSASAALWMDQVREDAAEYAADIDMQDSARRAAEASKARRKAAQPQQLLMPFCRADAVPAAQMALAF